MKDKVVDIGVKLKKDLRTKVEILSPVARCQAEYSESQLILLLIPFSRTSAYAYMNIEGSINPWACACTSVLHTL